MVFSTKNREPLPSLIVKRDVCKHIMDKCFEKEIHLQAIDGHVDHLHVLFELGGNQTIGSVAKQIKGESSNWINKEALTPYTFQWQDDYFAVSVSESKLEQVQNYILNQEQHHSDKTFTEELEWMNRKFIKELASLKRYI